MKRHGKVDFETLDSLKLLFFPRGVGFNVQRLNEETVERGRRSKSWQGVSV